MGIEYDSTLILGAIGVFVLISVIFLSIVLFIKKK